VDIACFAMRRWRFLGELRHILLPLEIADLLLLHGKFSPLSTAAS
jgi:hypothetical protein